MKLPKILQGTLSEKDVVAAVNLLIIQGKPTPMCCAGAVCMQRELSLMFGSAIFDVHYTKAHVSIKQERTPAKYWRKDRNAQEIDEAYDIAFSQAVNHFGNPIEWFSVRKRVERFILKRMQVFLGKPFTLTLKPARSKSEAKSRLDSSTGKIRGGHTRAIQCHETRTEKISKLLAKSLEDHAGSYEYFARNQLGHSTVRGA